MAATDRRELTYVKQLGRLYRTVRPLRSTQIRGQLKRTIRGPRVRPITAGGPPPILTFQKPGVPYLAPATHVARSEFLNPRALNREVLFDGSIDWNIELEGPLFAYHLHQMEWLRSDHISPQQRTQTMLDWIASHPVGIGWDGGPISLRSFQWVKMLTTPEEVSSDPDIRRSILSSLSDQIATLAANTETHLLGNHYLWNLLALAWFGLSANGGRSAQWPSLSRNLLRELHRQVLSDGVHEERSPMYHALLLENILDLVNVARTDCPEPRQGWISALEIVAAKMTGALRVLTHPDGEIALLGDSAVGIAARPDSLERYARELGIRPDDPSCPGVLRDAGYVRLNSGSFSLLATLSGPCPQHQPGHAHADALSFELLVGRERLVTDTGVFEYVPGCRRAFSRATRAHATAEIAGTDQCELWAAHRIGGRPTVEIIEIVPGRRIEATCSGWAMPGVSHRRRFSVDDRSVTIQDSFEGDEASIRMYFPLAPGVGLTINEKQALFALPLGGRVLLEASGLVALHEERTPYFPSFGIEQQRTCLVGDSRAPGRVTWTFRRSG